MSGPIWMGRDVERRVVFLRFPGADDGCENTGGRIKKNLERGGFGIQRYNRDVIGIA